MKDDKTRLANLVKDLYKNPPTNPLFFVSSKIEMEIVEEANKLLSDDQKFRIISIPRFTESK